MKKIRVKFAAAVLCVVTAAGMAAGQDAPDKLKTLADQASAAEDKGDYDQALKFLNAGLLLAPGGSKEAWFHTERGNVYFSKEDYDGAIKDYEEAIRLDPGHTLAFVGRGNAYDEKGDHDKAIADYSEAIRLDPKYPGAYINRAVTYNRKEMHDQAIADCNTALGLDPQSPDAYEDRAISYDGKGERDKAIADYNKVIGIDPKYAEAYANRGFDYQSAGAPDKAIADLNMAIQADAKYSHAYNQLAWLLATCADASVRDGRKAVEVASQACGLVEWKKASYVDTLAAAYAEAGSFDDAVKYEQWYLGFDGLSGKSVADGKARLALYQAHKAYHEEKKQ